MDLSPKVPEPHVLKKREPTWTGFGLKVKLTEISMHPYSFPGRWLQSSRWLREWEGLSVLRTSPYLEGCVLWMRSCLGNREAA